MDKLLEGYRKFRAGYWTDHRAVFEELAANGQAPRAMVIACCDSRVPPEVIFDASPGEILVVRNVAALVPPYAPDNEYHGTSAALEFAVRNLKIGQIIVLGHSRCGGVQALMRGADLQPTDFIATWMSIATAARDRVLGQGGHRYAEDGWDETARAGEYETIRVSLANLLTFPWIKEAVEAGRLHLYGWYFEVETAALERVMEGGS